MYTMSPVPPRYTRTAERGCTEITGCTPNSTSAPGGPPKIRICRGRPPQRIE
jgi:hypothetical protein